MPDPSSTILLVDDEDAIQSLLTYPLERDGYRVVQARDGAIHVLQSAGASISPPRRLDHPPPGFRGLHLVLIERGLGDAVPRLLASLHAAVAAARAP